jgi:predicted ribosome quality control (RQC) complex YloA/Tae2 family protein
MIKEESRKGNPVAQLIHSLKLETNQITLQLTFSLDDMDDETQTVPVTAVDVDLGLNAYTNAQNYYQTKKKVESKMEKTIANQSKALKGAERKAKQEIKNVEVKSAILQMRKPHWFEKFIYFVSSENFLVLAGRDAQQNELLVKRHMDKGDVYLHADIHGAATHIIKNHTKEPVPPLTLAQAGLACVCRSSAWDAKMVTSAYWVHPEQVSKSAPTGEYLSTGSFMIRGRKNFLPPNSLIMGFGLLFKLDESCLANHVGERRIRGMGDADTDASSVLGNNDMMEEEEEGALSYFFRAWDS